MNFAITGAAGYIAPRHLNAIKKTGNRLVAALDPHDSVGILDAYGFNVQYFSDFERFDRHLYKLHNTPEQIDFVSVCSPNHLHEAHARSALRAGASAIVEKPLVINPENLALLEENESANKKVWAILQMRYHPEILRLKANLEKKQKEYHRITMTYITPRGNWYHHSWKSDQEKSGGLTMNIGVHLFDLLFWLFGGLVGTRNNRATLYTTSGKLELQRAYIDWMLSIDPDYGQSADRKMEVDGEVYDFSKYGDELHTKAYEEILAGRGFTIQDARPALEFAHKLNQKTGN